MRNAWWIKKFGGIGLFLSVTNLATNRTESVMSGKWDEFLKKEERLRAKAMMYGAGAGGIITPNEEGNVVIEVVKVAKNGSD